MPGACPVGVDKALKTAGEIGFESKSLVFGGEEIATNPLDSCGMGLLGIVAEACALLNGHGEVWAYHSLKIAETANHRTVVPWVRVGGRVGIAIK